MKKIYFSLLTTSFVILNFELQTLNGHAQPGSLDLTFSSDGKVTTDFGSYDSGNSVAIQSDGKIVVAGKSFNFSPYSDFALVRYNSDGTLDNTFDSDGKATTDFGSSSDVSYSVAIQSDGKIVVVGNSNNGGYYDFAIVRYTTDGTLDNTFGSNGKVTTAIGSYNDDGKSVAIQSDGKIVVAGYSYIGSNNDFALVRYTTDGTLDTTFSSDGKVTTAISSSNDYGNSVAIQSDGKIVVAGYSYIGSNNDFALVRYTTDGTLDTTFSSDGKVTTAISSSNDYGNSVAIQSDGKIVVAGYSGDYPNDDFALIRYNTDGTLDTTFSYDGKVTTAIGSSGDGGYSVVIQSDGKIVVAGYSDGTSFNDFALVRYNTDGTLDNTFGSGGKVKTAIGSADDNGVSVAIQSDGKIVVAGQSYNGNNYDFAVVRYNNDVTGIAENTEPFNVSIYPNPTNNILNIYYDAQLSFDVASVIDITGRTIIEKKIVETLHTTSLQLNINEISSGFYFLELKSGNDYVYKKFIKVSSQN